MKKSTTGFASVAILTVVIIVLAGAAGYLAWDKRSEVAITPPPVPSGATPTLSPSSPPGPTSSSVGVTDWRVYRDGANGFEVKYPNNNDAHMDFSPTYDAGSGRVFGVNGVGRAHPPYYFSIYALPLREGGVPCREAAYGGASKFEFVGTINVSGKAYSKCIITRELQEDRVLSVSFNYKGKTWHFLAQQYSREHALIDQILSTFKFIDASQSEVLSLNIVPSKIVQNDVYYKKGAKVILTAYNIQAVEIRYVPRGTGMGEIYPDGKVLGNMVKVKNVDGIDTWEYALPDSLLTHGFWVVTTHKNGAKVKSDDFGSVVFEE